MKKQIVGRSLAPIEIIQDKIYIIRGQKVMLDRHLAELYGVTTKRFNEQVKRNIKRFPEDFMFRLTQNEYENLRSQIATSSWGGRRYLPYVFTDYGVAMLSSVLNSDRAIKVNLQIMRVFARLREIVTPHKDIVLKIKKLEAKVGRHNREIKNILEAIKRMWITKDDGYKKTKIGFIVDS